MSTRVVYNIKFVQLDLMSDYLMSSWCQIGWQIDDIIWQLLSPAHIVVKKKKKGFFALLHKILNGSDYKG